MNINVSIDCTPEEARRFMGLPDLTPLHDIYLDRLKSTMGEGVNPELLEGLMRTWAPMGEAGMNAWKQIVDQMARIGSSAKPG